MKIKQIKIGNSKIKKIHFWIPSNNPKETAGPKMFFSLIHLLMRLKFLSAPQIDLIMTRYPYLKQNIKSFVLNAFNIPKMSFFFSSVNDASILFQVRRTLFTAGAKARSRYWLLFDIQLNYFGVDPTSLSLFRLLLGEIEFSLKWKLFRGKKKIMIVNPNHLTCIFYWRISCCIPSNFRTYLRTIF